MFDFIAFYSGFKKLTCKEFWYSVLMLKSIGFLCIVLLAATTAISQEPDSIGVQQDSILMDIGEHNKIILKDSLPVQDSLAAKKIRPKPRKPKKNILFKDDSLAVFSYFAQYPEAYHKFADTLINNTFNQFDPSRTLDDNHASLGHLGSATEQLVFSLKPKMGTLIGFDHYDIYTKKVEDVKFYKALRSFTDVYYSQGNEQNDHIFKGSIGRTFANGFQLSVAHQRVIHSLDDPDLALNNNAFYNYQSNKNTHLLLGLAWEPENKKYSSYLTYAHNEVQAINHGGIEQGNPTIFSIIESADDLDEQFTVPVALSNTEAKTRIAQREVKYNHYYDFIRSKDEKSVQRSFNLGHSISYAFDSYKFSDESPDSSYYESFFDDERGIRMFLKTSALENYVSLSTAAQEAATEKLKFELGVRHVFNKIEQEFADSTVQNLFAEGKLKTKLLDLIEFDAFGQIGLLENIGDYRLDANLGLDLKKFGGLSATLIQQRYSPELIYQQLFLSQAQVWSNAFQKPFESELRFAYTLPSFKLKAQLSYFLVDNYLYFDENRVAAQLNEAINLVQIKVRKDLKIGILRMENHLVLQQSTNDAILRIPRWYTKHSLGIQGKLFKKVLLTRFGLDFRFNDTYFANGYFPLLGEFHVQNDREVDFYPAIDVHLAFKVQTFRFFFRMDNLTSFITDETFYQIPFYPQKEAAFRFGISWQFRDQHNSKKSTNRNTSNDNSNFNRNQF